jgi:hypothetical protein
MVHQSSLFLLQRRLLHTQVKTTIFWLQDKDLKPIDHLQHSVFVLWSIRKLLAQLEEVILGLQRVWQTCNPLVDEGRCQLVEADGNRSSLLNILINPIDLQIKHRASQLTSNQHSDQIVLILCRVSQLTSNQLSDRIV